VAPLAQAAVPAPQPAVTPSVTPPAAPASDPGPADAAPTSAPEPASGDEAAVEQQALLPEPTDGGTAGGAVPELPQDGGQGAEPSSPGAAPQSGEAAPRSLTKLRSAAAARR
jgi:hypothetical protein